LQRACKITHNRFFSAYKPAIAVDDNNVIRHQISQLFNFSGTYDSGPPNCKAADLLNFLRRRSACHMPPEKQMTGSSNLEQIFRKRQGVGSKSDSGILWRGQNKTATDAQLLRRTLLQPTPISSIFSSGVPHRRHITAAQSPQTSGSSTSILHNGQ
jgi:hypothetical protein